ncbi:MAG: very short patch repair endonuclease [Actinomycetota bacterium]
MERSGPDAKNVGRRPIATTPGTRRSMRSNCRVDTRPEVALRRVLHATGLRFRKDLRIVLNGTNVRPDVVFTRVKVAIFLDGCWWHRCPEHGMQPKRNAEFWARKFDENVFRDRRADAALMTANWAVIRVWEHEDLDLAAQRIVAVVNARRAADLV